MGEFSCVPGSLTALEGNPLLSSQLRITIEKEHRCSWKLQVTGFILSVASGELCTASSDTRAGLSALGAQRLQYRR